MADLVRVVGAIFDFEASMKTDTTPPRWVPSPLLYGSAVVHAGAAAATLLRPPLWPWMLGAVVLNHAVLTGAGLWPRSRWLGPNPKGLTTLYERRRSD